MQLSADTSTATYRINAYQTGRIQINETWYNQSLIITPEYLKTDWPPQSLTELSANHLTPLLELNPNIVILGSGNTLQFPAPELLMPFYSQQIGIEVMDTAAACRTYSVLAAENRNVVAALLIR